MTFINSIFLVNVIIIEFETMVIVCLYCNKGFKNSKSLATHRYTYHKKDDKHDSTDTHVSDDAASDESNQDKSVGIENESSDDVKGSDITQTDSAANNDDSTMDTETNTDREMVKRKRKRKKAGRIDNRNKRKRRRKTYDCNTYSSTTDSDSESGEDSSKPPFGLLWAFEFKHGLLPYTILNQEDFEPGDTPDFDPKLNLNKTQELLIEAVLSTEDLGHVCQLFTENRHDANKICRKVEKNCS